MIEIHAGSPAFEFIQGAMRSEDVYKISLAVREDTSQVSVKINERVWTAPLSTTEPILRSEGGR
jgi:hypothetical protein